jgi:hypothetical protein
LPRIRRNFGKIGGEMRERGRERGEKEERNCFPTFKREKENRK